MKTGIISSLLMFFVIFNLGAQTPSPSRIPSGGPGMVRGQVRDAHEHQLMEYASIVLFRERDSVMIDGCITNVEGAFEIKNLPYNSYYLTIQFVGFEKKYVSSIRCTKEQAVIDLGLLELQPSTSNLKGVEITSEVKAVEYSIDKKVVNVAKDAVASTGTALDALRNVPSVQVDAQGNVTLRGSSAFTLLVNGRPVNQDAADVLKQTPAGSVENIEIITNPSAKYDPDGTAGIINLVLRKNRRSGVNGLVNASWGPLAKYAADGHLDGRVGAFSIYGGAEYSNKEMSVRQVIDKTWYAGDTTRYTFSTVDQIYHPWHYKLNAGVDYDVDDRNALSLSGSWFRQDFAVQSPVAYHIFSEPAAGESWPYYTNDVLLKHFWGEGNLNYRHALKKKGGSFSVNLLYNRWKGDKSERQDASLMDAEWQNTVSVLSQRLRTYQNASTRFSGDADLVLPLGASMKLEAGYSGDLTGFQSDYAVDFWDSDLNNWLRDSSLTNGFDFRYQVHALYGTLGGTLWGLGYQLGLRAEYFHRDLVTQVPDTNYAMTVWSIFPSFHLSKEFKKGHQLMLSYSRRVNRPPVMALNPLPYFNDEYLIHTGNPSLRPEYADSYALSYQKTFRESFVSVEAYYRMTHDKIAETITINEGQTQLTNANLDNDQASGLEVMLNLALIKGLRINATLNGFYYYLNGSGEYNIPSRSAWSATALLSPSLSLKSGTVLQLQFMYNAPGVDATGRMEGFWMINAAVRQEFLKKKLVLTCSANNLFNLTKYRFSDAAPTYYHRFDYIPESNVITIGLSYRINNYTRKTPAQQGNGAMDVGF